MGHENEFNGLYGDILGWVSSTFGSERDPKGVILKAEEELDELWEAIEKWEKGWREKEELYGEVADLMILVVNLAGRLGLDSEMFLRTVRSKLEVNKEREWVKFPDGTWSHKRGGER